MSLRAQAKKRLAQGTETAPERHRRRDGGDNEGSLKFGPACPAAPHSRAYGLIEARIGLSLSSLSTATAVPFAENQRAVVGKSVSVSRQIAESLGEGDKSTEHTWRKVPLIAVLSHLKEMEWLR